MGMKEVKKNEMDQGCSRNEMGQGCLKNETDQGCPKNEMGLEVLNGLAQQECWAVKTRRRNNMRNWHGRRFSLQA